jgi:TatA/E family protein of Tat protein translocase
MPGWIGPWEIALLVVIVLIVFGPKRLPEMGRSLGRGMREFKNSITGEEEHRPLDPADARERFCGSCGHAVGSSDRFCSECGAAVTGPGQVS